MKFADSVTTRIALWIHLCQFKSGANVVGMKVKCPTCKIRIEYEGNPHRPFCSDRCRLIDIGEWASESFKVPICPHQSAENESESEFQTKTTHEKDPKNRDE